jgi:hypothetical protein
MAVQPVVRQMLHALRIFVWLPLCLLLCPMLPVSMLQGFLLILPLPPLLIQMIFVPLNLPFPMFRMIQVPGQFNLLLQIMLPLCPVIFFQKDMDYLFHHGFIVSPTPPSTCLNAIYELFHLLQL